MYIRPFLRFLLGSATVALFGSVLMPAAALAAGPTCTLSVVPSVITTGQSARLVWSMNNSTSGVFGGGRVVTTNGSDTIQPTVSRSYALAVADQSGGRGTCTANVTVNNAPAASQPPTCQMAVSPATIIRGNQATLSWRSSAGANVASIAQIGPVHPNDSTTVSPSVTTQYRMTVQNSAGSGTCLTTLNVGIANAVVTNPTTQTGRNVVTQVVSTGGGLTQRNNGSTVIVVEDDPWYSWLEPIWDVPTFVYDEVFMPVWEPVSIYFGLHDGEEGDDSDYQQYLDAKQDDADDLEIQQNEEQDDQQDIEIQQEEDAQNGFPATREGDDEGLSGPTGGVLIQEAETEDIHSESPDEIET